VRGRERGAHLGHDESIDGVERLVVHLDAAVPHLGPQLVPPQLDLAIALRRRARLDRRLARPEVAVDADEAREVQAAAAGGRRRDRGEERGLLLLAPCEIDVGLGRRREGRRRPLVAVVGGEGEEREDGAGAAAKVDDLLPDPESATAR